MAPPDTSSNTSGQHGWRVFRVVRFGLVFLLLWVPWGISKIRAQLDGSGGSLFAPTSPGLVDQLAGRVSGVSGVIARGEAALDLDTHPTALRRYTQTADVGLVAGSVERYEVDTTRTAPADPSGVSGASGTDLTFWRAKFKVDRKLSPDSESLPDALDVTFGPMRGKANPPIGKKLLLVIEEPNFSTTDPTQAGPRLVTAALRWQDDKLVDSLGQKLSLSEFTTLAAQMRWDSTQSSIPGS